MYKRFTVLVVLSVFLCAPQVLRAQLNVSIIDVGQGDAIYFEFPSGANALIDTGPGAPKITAFLKAKGVTKIDHLVLTHPHVDHYAGLKGVFTNLEVSNFYDTRMDNLETAGDEKARSFAEIEPGCATYYPAVGDKLNWDPDVDIQVLNACPDTVSSHKSAEINNCSIVLQVRYNGNSMLFMGDAESTVEDPLVAKYGSALQSVILKVAHHGARFASSDLFLNAVKPTCAYVSVGLDNHFGHPHKEALDRLMASGANILMTTEGTQSFTIPGKGVPYVAPIPHNSDAYKAIFEDMTLTWDPQAPVSGAPAITQLIAASASTPIR